MNTTFVWVVVGVLILFILYQIGRWVIWLRRREIPSMDYYVEHIDVDDDRPLIARIMRQLRGWKYRMTAVEESASPVIEDSVAMDGDEAEETLDDAPPIGLGIGDAKSLDEDETEAETEDDVLRVDVAVPPQVEVGRAFDMAVALRQMGASLLAEEDLTDVRSGPVTIAWEKEVDRAVINIRVTAPDCDIDEAEQSVILTRHQNEPPVYFLLTPRRTGRISIQVKVYQADLLLGNARIKTEATEEVGHVATEVTSHPFSLTTNDRRFLLQHLTNHFDLSELHQIVFIMGLDKDNFPTEKDALIIDLIQTCLQQGLVNELLTIGKEKRPSLSWQLEALS